MHKKMDFRCYQDHRSDGSLNVIIPILYKEHDIPMMLNEVVKILKLEPNASDIKLKRSKVHLDVIEVEFIWDGSDMVIPSLAHFIQTADYSKCYVKKPEYKKPEYIEPVKKQLKATPLPELHSKSGLTSKIIQISSNTIIDPDRGTVQVIVALCMDGSVHVSKDFCSWEILEEPFNVATEKYSSKALQKLEDENAKLKKIKSDLILMIEQNSNNLSSCLGMLRDRRDEYVKDSITCKELTNVIKIVDAVLKNNKGVY